MHSFTIVTFTRMYLAKFHYGVNNKYDKTMISFRDNKIKFKLTYAISFYIYFYATIRPKIQLNFHFIGGTS